MLAPCGPQARGAEPPRGGRHSVRYLAGARASLRTRGTPAADSGDPRRPLLGALSNGGGEPECPVGTGTYARVWTQLSETWTREKSLHLIPGGSLKKLRKQVLEISSPFPAEGKLVEVCPGASLMETRKTGLRAIQPSHPLSPPSPLAPNPSQHQSLFQ